MRAFSSLHPAVSMLHFAAVVAVGMFSTNPVIEVLSLAGGALFCATLTSPEQKKKDAVFYVFMMLAVVITNPLFSHNGVTELLFINGNPITLESVVYGCYMAVTAASVMLWFKVFGEIMTSDKIVFLFGRLLPQISLVLSMAFRYVPLIKRQAVKVSRAQKAMGLYSSEKVVDRIRSAVSVISVLIGWSLENAVEIAKSMKARGYGLKGKTNYSDFRFTKTDFCFVFGCLFLLVITVSGMAIGKLDFYYYPSITAVPSDIYSSICYAAYGLLAFLPFTFESGEMIRWKYYKSRI